MFWACFDGLCGLSVNLLLWGSLRWLLVSLVHLVVFGVLVFALVFVFCSLELAIVAIVISFGLLDLLLWF